MRSFVNALIVAATSLGCSCGAPTPTRTAPPPSAPPPAPAPTTVAEAPVDYEVHEWGLVRAEAGDAMRIGAIAPPVITAPMAVLKPVLYFHPSARMTLRSVDVTPGAGGSILEAYPLVTVGSSAHWTDVTIDPSGECTPSPLPTIADVACRGLSGDFCEVASLAVARTTDGACVTTNGTTDRFLFYRGRSTTLTPPLTFTREGNDVRVTSTTSLSIPGTLVRIRATAGGAYAVLAPPPAPNESVLVPIPNVRAADPAASLTAARTALNETMASLGLSSDEASAFMRAWDATIFPAGRAGSLRAPGLDAPTLGVLAPNDSFIYFLPLDATDEIASLSFDPPPSALRRAIAVWASLGRAGEIR